MSGFDEVLAKIQKQLDDMKSSLRSGRRRDTTEEARLDQEKHGEKHGALSTSSRKNVPTPSTADHRVQRS